MAEEEEVVVVELQGEAEDEVGEKVDFDVSDTFTN